jgi:hypothetical protein
LAWIAPTHCNFPGLRRVGVREAGRTETAAGRRRQVLTTVDFLTAPWRTKKTTRDVWSLCNKCRKKGETIKKINTRSGKPFL